MSDIRSIVFAAISETFHRYRGSVSEELTARKVPGWDSLSQVDLILLLEKRLGKRLNVAKTFELANVGELVKYIEKCE